MRNQTIFKTLFMGLVAGSLFLTSSMIVSAAESAAQTTVNQAVASEAVAPQTVAAQVAQPQPVVGQPVKVPPTAYQNAAHATPTQARTGYTRQEIRSMPLLNRPSRPGHFVGNTIRRRAGVAY